MQDDKTGLMNVLTCNDTTLASTGLPAKAEGIVSGKRSSYFRYRLKLKVTV
ncbi:hypothetical protein DPMN_194322 [Dreissena polymorpha]|uniref:Uncharacterized protein n=1 Tax=Dreissena polymorpha TaxID=45954 RepID=A0A9D4BEM4_DREPO|nr:hypothetical protein DPMN_194322 [Dreissena polymorpha]